MRVCDWIADYLYTHGVKYVHGLMGGGAAGLNDGFIKHGKIQYICYHNEQGAGHAAVGEAKYTGKISVVNPTTGCAGTNCMTSVLDAWQDSIPVLFLSGNVRLQTCSGWINENKKINLRKYGIQEHHIVNSVKSITKMSYFVTTETEVPRIIQEALYLATHGRHGPVWIDIPGDIQTRNMPESYNIFTPVDDTQNILFDPQSIITAMQKSLRPLVLIGDGIRQSNTINNFRYFIEKYKIPFVTTYGGRDVIESNHQMNIGPIGIRGSRSGNFALQNADLLIILGTSLGSSVIGYNPIQFSPFSHKILIDCDINEIKKDIVKIEEKYNIDLSIFFEAML